MTGFLGLKWAVLLGTAMALAMIGAIVAWVEYRDEVARAEYCRFVQCDAPGGHVQADKPIRMPRP